MNADNTDITSNSESQTSGNDPIVIIGTGLAGYTLAKELRKTDKDVPILMLTADDGHSYSKPMLSTGFTKNKTAEQLSMADPGRMVEQLAVDVRTFTTVTGIDAEKQCVLVGDEAITYSKLVLAWGADVIQLNIAGTAQESVYAVNDLLDYRRFREAVEGKQRILIMGAGLIGCEFANDLINGGFKVDIVAPCDGVLPGLVPDQAAAAVQDGLTEAGTTFHLGQVVESIDKVEDGVCCTLDNGTQVVVDAVLSAVGLRPRVQLAKDAGLTVAKGIVVNRLLETSAPNVYAMGDCAEVDGHVMLYVLPLMECARSLAKTLTGTPKEVTYGVMPVVIKTPCCPVAVLPPPVGAEGEWSVSGEGRDLKALFTDESGLVKGFALTGALVSERQALAKAVPPIHR
ncbi:NAD(P)H-nitrite reductase [Oleiphilus messinensis]|uniref:NAD(P)H-nitrite reductase n=1 Tax=Oleiphilus messinensis TaxID=141451 RepID=A0A1Y0IH71_9GAMM|nr:FAD-dependent oxidoreductase [Oleiphilus messinensis]ARU58753.1 NAD(P)H-nitrite reductase [Oleiphilus messinensis]